MLLKRLYVENLRSYKKQEVIFPKGSILLSGDIGSGKTTILEGLVGRRGYSSGNFKIFGKILCSILKPIF